MLNNKSKSNTKKNYQMDEKTLNNIIKLYFKENRMNKYSSNW